MRAVIPILVLALAAPGVWRAARLFHAGRSEPGRAVHMFPESSALQLKAGNIDRALQINPRLAQAWVRKGLEAELSGDLETAEGYLLEADRVSRMTLPRWTLANFYARRGDMDSFWVQARRTIDVVYSDPVPVFQLAWQMTGNAQEISAHLIGSRETLGRYLAFLLETNRVEAAAPMAIRLARDREAARTHGGILFRATDRLVAAGCIEEAVEVWNLLGEARVHPFGKLDRGLPLTNGRFAHRPLGQGFDWILSDSRSVSVYTTGEAAVASFPGDQPESLDLVWQYLPIQVGARLRLRFEYRTEGLSIGPQWRFAGRELEDQAPSDHWRETALPLPDGPGRLVLHTRRRAGTTRPAGTLVLRNIRLEPAP